MQHRLTAAINMAPGLSHDYFCVIVSPVRVACDWPVRQEDAVPHGLDVDRAACVHSLCPIGLALCMRDQVQGPRWPAQVARALRRAGLGDIAERGGVPSRGGLQARSWAGPVPPQ